MTRKSWPLEMKPNIRFVDVFADEGKNDRWGARAMEHPFFAWAGMRAPIAQHTLAEHQALERYARHSSSAVEIGVAEGASALALRQAMRPEGTLYLIDPFHLSRVRPLNFLRRAARRAVEQGPGARTVWIEEFSQKAVAGWKTPFDFLLIDGDHREEAVERDWNDWHPHATENGIVAFHDARIFPRGWTSPDYGPVRFIDRYFRQNPAGPWKIVEEVDSLVMVSRKKKQST